MEIKTLLRVLVSMCAALVSPSRGWAKLYMRNSRWTADAR